MAEYCLLPIWDGGPWVPDRCCFWREKDVDKKCPHIHKDFEPLEKLRSISTPESTYAISVACKLMISECRALPITVYWQSVYQ